MSIDTLLILILLLLSLGRSWSLRLVVRRVLVAMCVLCLLFLLVSCAAASRRCALLFVSPLQAWGARSDPQPSGADFARGACPPRKQPDAALLRPPVFFSFPDFSSSGRGPERVDRFGERSPSLLWPWRMPSFEAPCEGACGGVVLFSDWPSSWERRLLANLNDSVLSDEVLRARARPGRREPVFDFSDLRDEPSVFFPVAVRGFAHPRLSWRALWRRRIAESRQLNVGGRPFGRPPGAKDRKPRVRRWLRDPSRIERSEVES